MVQFKYPGNVVGVQTATAHLYAPLLEVLGDGAAVDPELVGQFVAACTVAIQSASSSLTSSTDVGCNEGLGSAYGGGATGDSDGMTALSASSTLTFTSSKRPTTSSGTTASPRALHNRAITDSSNSG
jgi:hypothetical protein